MRYFFNQKEDPVSLIELDWFEETCEVHRFIEVIFFYVVGDKVFTSNEI